MTSDRAPVTADGPVHRGRETSLLHEAPAGPEGVRGATGARAASFRAERFDRGFSLPRHLFVMGSLASLIGAVGVFLSWNGPTWVWVCVPAFIVVGNFVEWATHRFPMHRPLWPRVLYTNHSLVHHRAFEGHDMTIHEVRELSLVMMPWYTLVMIVVAVSPIAALAAWVGGPALAGAFYVSSAGYFLFYEAMHALHHLSRPALERWGVGRWSFYRAARAHHAHHHVLERMATCNFNVTFALADLVMGTSERPASDPETPRDAS